MVAYEPKKLKVEEMSESDSEINEETDREILRSIEKLQDIQDEIDKINDKASDEALIIEQKYNEIRKPVYDKRNEIINSIPYFWRTALLRHPGLGDLFTEDEQEIFEFFSSLEVEDFKDVKSGYYITFNFKPNPYFMDTKLTKSFSFPDEATTKISATAIQWKKGMGTPNGVRNEKKGKKRPPEDMSFFSWFSNTEPKDAIDGFHDEVAELIKEDLWSNPLPYFNNADEDEFGDEDDEEDDDDDDDDDDDGGEEEGK